MSKSFIYIWFCVILSSDKKTIKIMHNYFHKKKLIKANIAGKSISQKFRLKYIDETRNYLIEEINQNDLISKRHRKVCTV